MLYFQLFDTKIGGAIGESLGSDSVIPIDGRKSYHTAMLSVDNIKFKRGTVAYQLRKSPKNRYTPYTNLSNRVML